MTHGPPFVLFACVCCVCCVCCLVCCLLVVCLLSPSPRVPCCWSCIAAMARCGRLVRPRVHPLHVLCTCLVQAGFVVVVRVCVCVRVFVRVFVCYLPCTCSSAVALSVSAARTAGVCRRSGLVWTLCSALVSVPRRASSQRSQAFPRVVCVCSFVCVQ